MGDFQPEVPPVSDAVRAQAAKTPNAWVYAVDPYFEPLGKVPPYGVVGAWRVDNQGNVTDEFRPNPNYRPSPKARGFKAPTDPLDSVIQLAASGYASDSDVQSALVDAVVYVVPGMNAMVESHAEGDDRLVVHIYSSPMHAPSSVPEVQRALFRALLPELPECAVLQLNPGSSVSAEVPLADIQRAPRQ
ncbi:type VII secretion system-associated protein [Streptomyces gobitricini]|uniref:Type VII secretion system-associated protein n=1 Tax=Streptomyces gobitricini TaxID=68211 RepID=A0ABP5YWM8_9ACTN